jgi:hypothetical protein
MKTQFIITQNNVDFLFNFLNKEKYRHTSVIGNPYSNEIIKQNVKTQLLKDNKTWVALHYLELNEDVNTYSVFMKFYKGNDELLEVIKNLKANKEYEKK